MISTAGGGLMGSRGRARSDVRTVKGPLRCIHGIKFLLKVTFKNILLSFLSKVSFLSKLSRVYGILKVPRLFRGEKLLKACHTYSKGYFLQLFSKETYY